MLQRANIFHFARVLPATIVGCRALSCKLSRLAPNPGFLAVMNVFWVESMSSSASIFLRDVYGIRK